MSDAAQPNAAEVRAAAEAVKAALDRHLAAVERRSGEDDPTVNEAFNELAAAAEEYDELLYDRYDEVTPFEIPAAEDTHRPYTGPDEPTALSVLIRRDYAVVEPQRLQAQAERVEAADEDVTDGVTASEPVSGTVHGALGILFGEYEPDEIAARHAEFGLEEGDSTLWVLGADEVPDPGEWLDAPFDQIDPQHAVCRFDVSAVFDDDSEDDDAEDLLEDADLEDDDLEGDDDLDGVLDAARRGGAARSVGDADLLDDEPDDADDADDVNAADEADLERLEADR